MQTDANRLVSALMKIESLHNEIESLEDKIEAMQYVYVLQCGEHCEGSYLVRIYATEDDALHGLAVAFNASFDMWKHETDPHYVDFMPVWGILGDCFDSGCDNWGITKQEVLD